MDICSKVFFVPPFSGPWRRPLLQARPELQRVSSGVRFSKCRPERRWKEKDVVQETCLKLDCYWVGSLDFKFLVEIKGFPLNTQEVKLVAAGSTATKKGAHEKMCIQHHNFWMIGVCSPLAGIFTDAKMCIDCHELWMTVPRGYLGF